VAILAQNSSDASSFLASTVSGQQMFPSLSMFVPIAFSIALIVFIRLDFDD
jgi:hypothetical protein